METMTELSQANVGERHYQGNMCQSVVEAVAEAKGVDPLDLDPLYDVIDPDALEGMFQFPGRGPDASLELRFTMAGCTVVITGDGDVTATVEARGDEHRPFRA